MKIILASGSPRRKEILSGLGRSFTVLSADADESCSIPDPAEYAMELAKRKALAALQELRRRAASGNDDTDALLISADTVVATDNEILGKPRNEADAYRMLSALSGKKHRVITGIALTLGGTMLVDYCSTTVSVAPIPKAEIKKYIASGDPFDKAGAYGIQGEFSKWIEGIDGCYFNVVGLPTHTLNKLFFELTGEYI